MSCAMPITPRTSQRRSTAVPTVPAVLTSDMRFTNLEILSPFRVTDGHRPRRT
jgi:hypothetical protein